MLRGDDAPPEPWRPAARRRYFYLFGSTHEMREWVAADTHDPTLVRPYSPDTVDADAYREMRAFRSPIVATHESGFFILLALIAIHVAAAVFSELKEGGGAISAMFTGRKVSASEPADLESQRGPPR